jgi:hypothetical protein
VRARAAKDLIEIAHGRPETRAPGESAGGIHVTINKFTMADPRIPPPPPIVVEDVGGASEVEIGTEAPAIEAEFENLTVDAPDWREDLRSGLAEIEKSR